MICQKTREGEAPQGGGHLVEAALTGSQRGFEGDDEEGQGDEDLRDNDGCRRKSDVEAGTAQQGTQHRAPAEGREQRDAGNDGRQRERQGDEDTGGAHAPPRAGQDEGSGHPEEEVNAEGHGARAQRQAQGGGGLGRRERGHQAGPVDAPQHERKGQDQKAQGERAEAPRPDGQGADGGRPA